MTKAIKIGGVFILILLILLLLATYLISREKYQNKLAQEAVEYLERKLGTDVAIERVKIDFFNAAHLQGVFIQDESKDTLAYIGDVQLNTSSIWKDYWNDRTPTVKKLKLKDAYINLKRSADTSRWNFAFIEEAFATDEKDKKAEDPKFDVKQVNFDDVRFNMKDEWIGRNMQYDVGKLDLAVDEFILAEKRIIIDRILLQDIVVGIDEFKGGIPEVSGPVDKTNWGSAFNTDMFQIEVKELAMIDGSFDYLKDKHRSEVGRFDERHIEARDINFSITDVNVLGDSLAANIRSLSTTDRSGLQIEQLSGQLALTQKKASINDLVLKTPHSLVKDYFSMEYSNFHDFNEFLFAVKMNANFKDSYVSNVDIAYFGPVVKQYPIVVKLSSGAVKGTVNDLHAKGLDISNGKTRFQGDVDIVGLPEAEVADFFVRADKLTTSGPELNRLIPQTRVPQLHWNRISYANYKGTFKGKIDNFILDGMLQTNEGDVVVDMAMNLGRKPVYFDGNVKTKNLRLDRIINQKGIEEVNWASLSNIEYDGFFEGPYKNFHVVGNLFTNQGDAVVDLNMNLTNSIPKYRGVISTKGFALGTVLRQKDIGSVALSGNIEGEGFDLESLHTAVDAKIYSLQFQGKTYRDIVLNGDVAQKKFNGKLYSADPNYNLNFEGGLDLSGQNPLYDFNISVSRLNLKTFGLSDEDIFVTTKSKLDFQGKTIDDFIGMADLKDVLLEFRGKTIFVQEAYLKSFYKGGDKVLEVKSSVVDGRLKGVYSMNGLQHSVQSFLHYYMPQYIKKGQESTREHFVFDVELKEINPIFKFFELGVIVGQGTKFKGEIQSSNQILELDGEIPFLSLENGLDVDDILLKTSGNYQILNVDLNASAMRYKGEQIVQNLSALCAMASDTAHLTIQTKPVNELLGDALLDCRATASNQTLYVDLLPSSIVLKNDKWELNSAHPIIINGKNVVAEDFIVSNANQSIVLNVFNEEGFNNALIKTSDLDLEKVAQYLGGEYELVGRLNNEIAVRDIWGAREIAGNITSGTPIRLGADTIGTGGVYFTWNEKDNTLNLLEGTTLTRDNASVELDGTIDLNTNELKLNAFVDQTPLNVLEPFLNSYVENLEGAVSGTLKIQGPSKSPDIIGDVLVEDTKLKVIYTGVSYRLEDFKLNLEKDAFTFDPIKILDSRDEQGYGFLTGMIRHENLSSYQFDLNFESEDLLALNTDKFTGDMFYGYINSRISRMSVTGTLDDIVLDIKAKPLEGSRFVLPISSSGDAGIYDYVKFVNVGTLQKDLNQKKKSTYFLVKMELDVDSNTTASIILDQNTGEEIRATGSGIIDLTVDLGNDIDLRGDYTIEEGNYFFNFRSLLRRKFDLEKGGTIKWSGDPYDANLDLKAVYKENLNLYPLVSGEISAGALSDAEKREAKHKYDTYIATKIVGKLSDPNITFDITQPENQSKGTLAYGKLQQIRKDPNELIYQAGMILLMRSFKPMQGGVSAGSLLSGTGQSTISDLVETALSPVLNNAINKITGTENINVDLGFRQYSTSAENLSLNTSNQVNLGVQAKLLNDRVILDFSNSIDIGNDNQNADGNLAYGGDFRAHYLVTPDGRLRVNAFTSGTTYDDFLNKPSARGGVGISYRTVFNNFSDLFARKEKDRVVSPISDSTQSIP